MKLRGVNFMQFIDISHIFNNFITFMGSFEMVYH